MDGAMFNAGQCCCGIERIYVHRSKFDGFVDRAVAWTKQLRLGNPLELNTSIGPMANRRFADTVRAQTQEAIAAGAPPLFGREVFPEDDGGPSVAPQILPNVDHSMRVMREESFGPVVGIMPVSGDDEALALMNDSPYGLTASLWTQDPGRAARLGRLIDTGTVFMNRADYLDPALTWTGTKDTGRGAALSALGYQSVTRPRSYHFRKAKG
jgi:acyl-CoA reductase-like NAD-dependent aldehyde dehydrogenase